MRQFCINGALLLLQWAANRLLLDVFPPKPVQAFVSRTKILTARAANNSAASGPASPQAF